MNEIKLVFLKKFLLKSLLILKKNVYKIFNETSL